MGEGRGTVGVKRAMTRRTENWTLPDTLKRKEVKKNGMAEKK